MAVFSEEYTKKESRFSETAIAQISPPGGVNQIPQTFR
jgi:hypothetical protein